MLHCNNTHRDIQDYSLLSQYCFSIHVTSSVSETLSFCFRHPNSFNFISLFHTISYVSYYSLCHVLYMVRGSQKHNPYYIWILDRKYVLLLIFQLQLVFLVLCEAESGFRQDLPCNVFSHPIVNHVCYSHSSSSQVFLFLPLFHLGNLSQRKAI